MTTLLIAMFFVGWTAAAIIVTQAFESETFELLASFFTGRETNCAEQRIPVIAVDAYASNNLPRR